MEKDSTVRSNSLKFKQDYTIPVKVNIEALEELVDTVGKLAARIEMLESGSVGGGAETDLSNIYQDIVPSDRLNVDLGNHANAFCEGHIQNLYVDQMWPAFPSGMIRFAHGTTVDLRGCIVLADDIALTKKDQS